MQSVADPQQPGARGRVGRSTATTAASSGSSALPAATTAEPAGGSMPAAALQKLLYISPDLQWVVRPLDKSNLAEVGQVVALQTDAFHVPAAVPMLDGMAKRFFAAEVLAEMQKKLKFNPDDMFLSLVIEPAAARAASGASSSSGSGGSPGGAACNVIGVVEISYVAQKDTLKLLEPGTAAFCYIASMVVAPAWRRRGAAAALLAAAERAAEAWDEEQALLHVYQDNEAAIQLYQQAGYKVLWRQNPAWGALGTRPRYLMRKQW